MDDESELKEGLKGSGQVDRSGKKGCCNKSKTFWALLVTSTILIIGAVVGAVLYFFVFVSTCDSSCKGLLNLQIASQYYFK